MLEHVALADIPSQYRHILVTGSFPQKKNKVAFSAYFGLKMRLFFHF
jgi:hypothetical protein